MANIRDGLLLIVYMFSQIFLHCRSPRWTSGNPRMLLLILWMVLVLELESRRGEIVNLFAKIQRDRQLLRAPSVGKHDSTL